MNLKYRITTNDHITKLRRARIVVIICIAISREIPQWYRDRRGGISRSIYWLRLTQFVIWVCQATNHTSLSFPLLVQWLLSNGSSWPVCSTSSYMVRPNTLYTCLTESRYRSKTTISLCQVNVTISSSCEVRNDIVGRDHTIRSLILPKLCQKMTCNAHIYPCNSIYYGVWLHVIQFSILNW